MVLVFTNWSSGNDLYNRTKFNGFSCMSFYSSTFGHNLMVQRVQNTATNLNNNRLVHFIAHDNSLQLGNFLMRTFYWFEMVRHFILISSLSRWSTYAKHPAYILLKDGAYPTVH